jgi:hypothetical protein
MTADTNSALATTRPRLRRGGRRRTAGGAGMSGGTNRRHHRAKGRFQITEMQDVPGFIGFRCVESAKVCTQ